MSLPPLVIFPLKPGFRPPKEEAENGARLIEAVSEQLRKSIAESGRSNRRVLNRQEFLELASESRLTIEQKLAIVDQATLLFHQLYVHLPFKAERYGDRLRVGRLETLRGEAAGMTDGQFHGEMLDIFRSVVDPHTWYLAPPPWRGTVAMLPFDIRVWRDETDIPFIGVSNVAPGFEHEHFCRGADITHWDDQEVAEAVIASNAASAPSRDIGIARGLLPSVFRPLRARPLPQADRVELRYISPKDGNLRAISLPWIFVTDFADRAPSGKLKMSLNVDADLTITAARRVLTSLGRGSAAESAADTKKETATRTSAFETQVTGETASGTPVDPSRLADPRGGSAKFGYVRIRNFGDGDFGDVALVREFRSILGKMQREAPDGLVIDIRANPGGNVVAAERMLQMLTAKEIEPMRFQLPNTEGVRQALAQLRDRPRKILSPFAPWIADLDNWSKSGSALSSAHPITRRERANDIGQVYFGKCVLLTDAIAYSSADIFAAGFQDHGIGLIAGVDSSTGAGGANVIEHSALVDRLPNTPALPLKTLDSGVEMTVAFRRCVRVGLHAGVAVEDDGVVPDVTYSPDAESHAAGRFDEVVSHACRFLSDKREFRIVVEDVQEFHPTLEEQATDRIVAAVRAENIDQLVVFFAGQDMAARLEVPVTPGERTILRAPVPSTPLLLKIEGYAEVAGKRILARTVSGKPFITPIGAQAKPQVFQHTLAFDPAP